VLYLFVLFVCLTVLFNVSVWVRNYELELDPETVACTPGDGVLLNSVYWCYKHHDGLCWNDVLSLFETWATCPGEHDFDVVPAR